jgi:membrane-bound lytic murein transglycosylase F
VLVVVAVAGCGGGGAGDREVTHREDLAGIRDRGVLRILVEADDETYLPRGGDPLIEERTLALEFAARQGLEGRLIRVDRFGDLLPALADGRGDLVAANVTMTAERSERFGFTRAIDTTRELLVLAADRTVPATVADASGRIGARSGTTFAETARRLAAAHEALEAVVYAGAITNEALLDSVVAGRIDFAIQDSNRLDVILGYRKGLQRGPAVSAPRNVAWVVRRENPELRRELSAFLYEMDLLGAAPERSTADLPAIRQSGRIRMITRNNAATYFLWRGRLLGFEYELAQRFARSQGLRLEVLVAPSHDDLLPMLLDGRGDFVAAFLTRTAAREEQGVAFSRPYHHATEVVVGDADDTPLESVADLAGRRIAVREASAYWTHLERLRAEHAVDFELVVAPADMETEEIMARVADGTYDLTVADSHLLELEMTYRDDLQGILQLDGRRDHGWAVRQDNPQLLAAIDAFLAENYRGLFYNMRYERYFERPRYLPETREHAGDGLTLSPYDDIVRELAPLHGLDWRLVVAQMYQESRFDPDAESWAGARGLMQVMPRTARELGIEDLHDPRESIEAGLRSLDWVYDRFPDRLEPAERLWLALAGYNAGHGHVRDARRLAQSLGYDPDRWFDHVEKAMLLLSRPEYANKARHGYVRGEEPVAYVRAIRDRYRAYVDILRHGVRRDDG